jgi:hypothetical protein
VRTIVSLKYVAEDYTFSGVGPVFKQQFTLTLFLLGSETLQNVTLSIELAVLSTVDNHVHSVALSAYSSSGYQVAAERGVLGQIGSEVHFLPLKFFPQTILSRESEFAQMPTFNEVNLAITGQVIHLLRVTFVVTKHLLRVESLVGSVVLEQKGVFFAIEPPRFSRKLYHLILVQTCS